MKYKILLAGKASSIIDDFFQRLTDSFEIMTTSLWHDDILRHVKYFQPHMFLFCMYNESREDFNRMLSLKYQLVKSRVYFGLIGSQTDVTDFERAAVNVADLTMVKPLTIDVIQKRIQKFLEAHRPMDTQDTNTDSAAAAQPDSFTVSSNAVAAAAAKTASNITAEIAALTSPQRKHILVVDDDPRMLKMLKEQLHHDYDVGTAVNGKIAMKFLESKHTDLILLDYEMPDEKGPDVLEKIRANRSTKDVPVIFLTGVTEREKIQKALVLQPQGYLLKPINHDRLIETITKVLEG
ncbi:MAG: response regulator [Acetatifactor sp.]|nr:response regulator [Acetatifactor sp.]